MTRLLAIALLGLLVYILFVRKGSMMILAPVRRQMDIISDESGYMPIRMQTAHTPGQGPQAAYNMMPGDF